MYSAVISNQLPIISSQLQQQILLALNFVFSRNKQKKSSLRYCIEVL